VSTGRRDEAGIELVLPLLTIGVLVVGVNLTKLEKTVGK
jgi:hypothetical protein